MDKILNVEDLKLTIKQQIISELNLEDITPNDIADDAPLFGDGLGLDSIDALELFVIMEKYHGIIITDESVGKKVLASISSMADYIMQEKKKSE